MLYSRTFYTVEGYSLMHVGDGESRWCWRSKGTGGNTIEEAHARLVDDIRRLGKFDRSKVKFIIKKEVHIITVEEEYFDDDLTALILTTR